MLKKKIMSMALAGALALSLSVPAFAGNSTKITGTYSEIPIEVTVPTTGTAQINPYGLAVKLDDTSSITGSKIVTKPLAIVNKSEMKLDVNATVTGEVKGNFKFAAADAKFEGEGALTTNSALVFLQMKASELKNADLDSAATAICGIDAAKLNAEVAGWTAATEPEAKDLVVSTKATSSEEAMITLTAANEDGEVQEGGIALFRLAGNVVANPKTAWAKSDGFTTTVAFTFTVNTETT